MNLHFPVPFLCFLPHSLPFSVSLSPSLLVSGSIYLENFTFKECAALLAARLLSACCLVAWSPAAAFEIALCRSGESCSFCLVLLGGFSSSPLSTISRLNTVSAAILEEHFHKLQTLPPGSSLRNAWFATAEDDEGPVDVSVHSVPCSVSVDCHDADAHTVSHPCILRAIQD